METNMLATLIIMVLTGFTAGFGVYLYMIIHPNGAHTGKNKPFERSAVEKNGARENFDERFHLAPLGNLDEEYINLFSNPPMDKAARRGKSAYLRDAYHERIRRIVNALNIEGVNISSYVDMVLTDHLMRYEEQIDKLIQKSNNQGKKQWQVS